MALILSTKLSCQFFFAGRRKKGGKGAVTSGVPDFLVQSLQVSGFGVKDIDILGF